MRSLRIITLGYIVRGPVGGLAWHHLQYVMGLARLGHDVYFVEDSDDYPSCYDPSRQVTDTDATYGLRFAEATFAKAGLADRWAYFDAHTTRWYGTNGDRLPRICANADIVLNLSGANPLRPWLRQAPVRVFVDTDPVFTQIRHLTDPAARERALQHTAFFSFGANVGQAGATVPDDGFPWIQTRQPVVLEVWPVTSGRPEGRFTTVMQWNSYKPQTYGGRTFGMKSASFRPYLTLPHKVNADFELAAGGPRVPEALLKAHGWILRNPLRPGETPWTYQHYIRHSLAEFSVAKHGYVESGSGWFSERSAGYLASGRPVVLQDTGFSRWLPTGDGLLAFASADDAVDAVMDVMRRYEHHCEAARTLAEDYFDSDAVLGELIAASQEASQVDSVRATATREAPTEAL